MQKNNRVSKSNHCSNFRFLCLSVVVLGGWVPLWLVALCWVVGGVLKRVFVR